MDQMSSRKHVFARLVSPLINRIKRVVMEIGVFTDSKAYKDEIARYESELQQKAGYENEPRLKNEAEERDATTS